MLLNNQLVLKTGKTYSAFLTDVNFSTEGDLVIWAQFGEECLDTLDEISDALQNGSTKFQQLSEVKEGVVCTCKFIEDEQWYRACVHTKLSCGKWKVQFIDYGNYQVLDECELYSLPTHLSEPCALAVPLLLHESIEPLNSSSLWTNAASKAILDSLIYNDLEIEVTNECGNGNYKIYCQAICDVLIEKELASKAKSYPFDYFPLGTKFQGYLSHFTESGTLYIQKLENSSKLDELMDSMANYFAITDNQIPLSNEELVVGNLVAAVYPIDQSYYRAQILSIDDGSCTVHYVDYGNTEQQFTTSLYKLPRHFLNLRYQAIKCYLFDIVISPEHYSKHLQAVLTDTVLSQLIDIKVVEHLHNSLGKLSIKASHENQSLSSMLLIKGFAKLLNAEESFSYKYMKIEEGSQHSVIISHVASDGKFFVNLMSTASQLDGVMNDVAEHCSDVATKPMLSICDDRPCCALFTEDNVWYRGLVQDFDAATVSVWFVDFGNTDHCDRSSVKRTRQQLMELRCQAIGCSILRALTEKEIDQLQALVGEVVQVKFLKKEKQNTFIVKLIYHGATLFTSEVQNSDVNKSALESTYKDSINAANLNAPTGSALKVRIVNVVSLDNVWGRLLAKDEIYQGMLSDLNSTYSSVESHDCFESTCIELGTLCVVQNPQNGKWFRGKILHMPENTIYSVFLIDEGILIHHCTQATIKKCVLERFVNFPAQAINFSLVKCTNNETSITQTDQQFAEFCQVLLDSVFTAKFVSGNTYTGLSDIPLAKLYDTTGVCINAHLLKSATATPPSSLVDESCTELSSDVSPTMTCSTACDTFVDVSCFVEDLDCMWIKECSNQEQLSALMKDMSAFFSQVANDDMCLQNPNVDDLCAVRRADSKMEHNWFRGRVLCTYADVVEVKLIDFGNEVKAKLEDVKTLPIQFINALNAQAIKCKLFNVKPIEKRWSSVANKIVAALLNPVNKVSCKFIQTSGSTRTVDLIAITDSNKIRINEHLVLHEHAVWVDECIAGSTASFCSAKSPTNSRKSTSLVKSNTQRYFYHSLGMALVGSEIEVSVCEVTSPDEFFLKINDPIHLQRYAALSDEVKAACLKSGNNILQYVDLYVGMPCAVFCNKKKQWCRGAILCYQDQNNLQVCLVDFGNVIHAALSDIKSLNPKFVMSASPAAMRCTLRGIVNPLNETWSCDAVELCQEFFCKHNLNISCTIHGCASDDLGTYFICSVRTPLIDLAEQLEEAGFAKKLSVVGQLPSPLKLKSFVYSNLNVVKGREELFYVAHIETPDLLYCQLPCHFEHIDSMMDDLQVVCNRENQLVTPEVLASDCLCFAKYVDQWYRAHFLSVDRNGLVKVMFVDYGNTEIVRLNDVRRFSDCKFSELPIQALPCSLEGVSLATSAMEETELLKLMQDILLEKQFSGVVTGSTNGKLHLSLFDHEKRINDLLQKDRNVTLNKEIPDTKEWQCCNGNNDHIDNAELIEPSFVHVGAMESVFLATFVNLGNFYVQFEKLIEKQQTCQSTVDGFYTAVRNSDFSWDMLSCGDAVCAKRESDLKWHRGVLMSDAKSTDVGIQVCFVDSGETELISESLNIKKLTPTMAHWPKMSVRCCLAGVKPSSYESWNSKAMSMIQLASNKGRLKANFLHKDSNDTWLVNLNDGEGDIASKLTEMALVKSDKKELLQGSGISIEPRCVWEDQKEVYFGSILSQSEIFLQPAEIIPKLDELMMELKAELDLEHFSKEELVENSFCLARFELDNQFYRAVILKRIDLDSNDSCLFDVRFIDYGNTSTVRFEDLRKIPKKYFCFPQAAIHCKLEPLLKHDSSDKVVTQLQDLSISDNVSVWASFLPSELEDIPVAVLKIQQLQKEPVSLNMFLFGIEDVKSQTEVVRKTDELPKYKILQDILNKPNRKVYISHVENPGHLYCQFSEYCDDLDTIMDNIEAYYKVDRDEDKFKSTASLHVGLSCIAKYTEDDNWYRAVVKSIEDEKVTVQFVDYGNSEVTTLSNVRKSKIAFCILPVQSVHCYVARVSHDKNDWSKEEISAFDNRVASLELQATFSTMLDEKDHIYEVMLRLPDQTLLNKEYVREQKPETYGLGESSTLVVDFPSIDEERTEECYASFAVSPNNFYVQFAGAESELDQIFVLTADNAATASSTDSDSFQLNSYCIAKSSDDEEWYRGQIIKLGERPEVCFVDYGNTAVVDWKDVKLLSKKCAAPYIQAIPCCLANLPRFPDDSIQSVLELFLEIVMEKSLSIKFHEKVQDNRWKVTMTVNGEDVVKKLQSFNSTRSKSNETSLLDHSTTLPTQPTPIESTAIHLPTSENVASVSRFLTTGEVVFAHSLSSFYVKVKAEDSLFFEQKVIAKEQTLDIFMAKQHDCDEWLPASPVQDLEGRNYVLFADKGIIVDLEKVDQSRKFQPLTDAPYSLFHCSLVSANTSNIGMLNYLTREVIGKEVVISFEEFKESKMLWFVELKLITDISTAYGSLAMKDNSNSLEEEQTLKKKSQFVPSAISTPTLPDIVVTDSEIASKANISDIQLDGNGDLALYNNVDAYTNYIKQVFLQLKGLLQQSTPTETLASKIDSALSFIENFDNASGRVLHVGDGDSNLISSHCDNKRPSVTLGVACPCKKPRLEKHSQASTGTSVIFSSITEVSEEHAETVSDVLPRQSKLDLELQQVAVLYMENPGSFFVQPSVVSKIEKDVANFSKLKLLETSEIGHICAFQVDDDLEPASIKRGVILNKMETEIEVQDLDSGFRYILKPSQVFELPEPLKHYPPLAVHCSIYDISPTDEQWSSDACDYFSDLLSTNENISVKFIKESNHEYSLPSWSVELFVDESSVSRLLVENKFATFSNLPRLEQLDDNQSLEHSVIDKSSSTAFDEADLKGQDEETSGCLDSDEAIPLIDMAKLASSGGLVSFSCTGNGTDLPLSSAMFVVSTKKCVSVDAESPSQTCDSVFEHDEEQSSAALSLAVPSKLTSWQIYHSSSQTPTCAEENPSVPHSNKLQIDENLQVPIGAGKENDSEYMLGSEPATSHEAPEDVKVGSSHESDVECYSDHVTSNQDAREATEANNILEEDDDHFEASLPINTVHFENQPDISSSELNTDLLVQTAINIVDEAYRKALSLYIDEISNQSVASTDSVNENCKSDDLSDGSLTESTEADDGCSILNIVTVTDVTCNQNINVEDGQEITEATETSSDAHFSDVQDEQNIDLYDSSEATVKNELATETETPDHVDDVAQSQSSGNAKGEGDDFVGETNTRGIDKEGTSKSNSEVMHESDAFQSNEQFSGDSDEDNSFKSVEAKVPAENYFLQKVNASQQADDSSLSSDHSPEDLSESEQVELEAISDHAKNDETGNLENECNVLFLPEETPSVEKDISSAPDEAS